MEEKGRAGGSRVLVEREGIGQRDKVGWLGTACTTQSLARCWWWDVGIWIVGVTDMVGVYAVVAASRWC